VITSLLGAWVRRMAQRFGSVVAKSGLTPNVLTVLGLLLNVFVGYILSTGQLLVGGILILVAGLFDVLDGAVARATGKSTKFGAFLDSTLDRYAEIAVYLGLLFYFSHQRDFTLPAVLIFAVISGSLMTSYTRARAESLGLSCEVGLLARPERVVILAAGVLLNQIVIALWILAFLTHVTAAQRIIHIWNATRRAEKAASAEEAASGEEKVPTGRHFHFTR
jgi:CDP-diacylglycerol---glycerol-3-phosphate 3-phosphatidyltransferase